MSARLWLGVTRAAQADKYLNHVLVVAVPDHKPTPGNRGVYVMRHMEGDEARISCSPSGTQMTRHGGSLACRWEARSTPCSTLITCSPVHP